MPLLLHRLSRPRMSAEDKGASYLTVSEVVYALGRRDLEGGPRGDSWCSRPLLLVLVLLLLLWWLTVADADGSKASAVLGENLH